MQQFDQLDLTNVASGEMLARWLLIIEAAVERSPRNPDFTGLEGLLAAPVSDRGSLMVPEWKKFVADKQQSEAQILKQGRLVREERAAEERRAAGALGG
eukprot:4534738-Alexandrium_andersonii.AAC.1